MPSSIEVTEPIETPAVTVDVLVFTIAEGELKIALIERGIKPFKGMWAIPGGFVLPGESLEDAALRELREEAGVSEVYLEQLYTFGDPGRDPRKRVITVAYYALAPAERIVKRALDRLRGKLEYSNIAFALLPERFRLGELQNVYEAILDRKLDKRNFRKRIVSLGLLEATDEIDSSGAHRPARLYRFRERRMVAFD